MATTTQLLLSELYTAYFNRAPDAAGLAYWEGQLNNGSMDFDAIAQNWANEQPEFVQTYGVNPDPDTLINKVYQNVLGRDPDSDGATYWSEQLANGNVSTSALIEAVVAGAKAPTGSAQDAQLLQNKATVGVKVAEAGIDDITFAKKVVQAVSADTNTVGVVTGLIEVAKADTTAEVKDALVTKGVVAATATVGITEGNDDGSADIVTLTATDISAIASKTSGGVSIAAVTPSGSNLQDTITISGTTDEVQAAATVANVTVDANTNATVSDTEVAAAKLTAIDAKVGTVTGANITTLTGTASEVKAVTDNLSTIIVGTVSGGASSTNVTLTDAEGSTIVAADLAAIDANTGTVTVTNTVKITGTASNDAIDVSGITFTTNEVYIDSDDGNDSVTGGSGNDIIRGGAGADILNGGAGDDTFVVLGTIAAGDYTVADVATTTGAYKLGLATLIDDGLTTSDTGLNTDGVTYDGTGETYAGGAGINSIEIWGTADLTAATLTDIDAINTHSDLTISATQLQSLFASNPNGVDLNLFSDASTVTITDVTQGTGLALLKTFNTNIDQGLLSDWSINGLPATMPTVAFDLYALDPNNATTYTIKPEDMFDLTGANDTLTDVNGENSVIYADTTTSSIRTINAGDGDDIIVVDGMSSSVTVNGGAGDDILAFEDTNSATDDLDNVTNV